jgi:hypothetical protein
MHDRKSFAGKYFCYNLIYYEWYPFIQSAIAREKEIKGWKREKKIKLIESFNPDWRFLNDKNEIAKGDLPVWYVGDDYWQPRMEKKPPGQNNQPPLAPATPQCRPERSEEPETTTMNYEQTLTITFPQIPRIFANFFPKNCVLQQRISAKCFQNTTSSSSAQAMRVVKQPWALPTSARRCYWPP